MEPGCALLCLTSASVSRKVEQQRMSQSIGLADLIQQVKQDLLSTVPGESADAPIFLVESVELELKVAVRQEGKTGIKIDVLAIGGGEVGAGVSQDKTHTVKVKLSPLFDKERLMEFYQTFHPDKVIASAKRSQDALLKGPEANPDDRY
jgi:Trypsin-co-occurring domain 2